MKHFVATKGIIVEGAQNHTHQHQRGKKTASTREHDEQEMS